MCVYLYTIQVAIIDMDYKLLHFYQPTVAELLFHIFSTDIDGTNNGSTISSNPNRICRCINGQPDCSDPPTPQEVSGHQTVRGSAGGRRRRDGGEGGRGGEGEGREGGKEEERWRGGREGGGEGEGREGGREGGGEGEGREGGRGGGEGDSVTITKNMFIIISWVDCHRCACVH